MPKSEVPAEVLKDAGMVREGHFALGDLHTSSVIVRDRLFADAMSSSTLCIDIAQHFRDEHIDVVAGPAPRATNLIQFVSKSMYICQDQKRDVRCVYGLKSGKNPIAFRFPETFLPLLKGKRVLVVVDFMKSGDTVLAFIKAVRDAGGIVVGVACICQRLPITAAELGVPRLFSLVYKGDETWFAEACPLCREGKIELEPSPNEENGYTTGLYQKLQPLETETKPTAPKTEAVRQDPVREKPLWERAVMRILRFALF